MNNVPTSYLLWLFWLVGIGGVHRIYNKKYISGLFWFFTWGFFGLGQIIDLFLIPDMVDNHNWKMQRRLGMTPGSNQLAGGIYAPSQTYHPSNNFPPVVNTPIDKDKKNLQSMPDSEIMIQLAKVAEKRGGQLSITQAVIDTELSYERVEHVLQIMTQKGYVVVGNDPVKGHIIYEFTDI